MPSDAASQTRSGPRGWPADRWPLATVHREADVVGALRAGDEAAFVELVRRHHATMLHVARGFVATDAVAEEVVQETWVAVLDRLDRFEGRSSLKTWIFRILVNRAKTPRGARAPARPVLLVRSATATTARPSIPRSSVTAPGRPRRGRGRTPSAG